MMNSARVRPRLGPTLLTPLLLLLVPSPASGQAVVVSPSTIDQGGVAFVTVQGDPAAPLEIRFRNETLPLHYEDGEWRGVVGASPDTAPAVHPLHIRRPGGAVVHKTTVTVRKVKYQVQHLRMARSTARLYNAPGTQKEDAEVSAALRVRSKKRLWSGDWRLPATGRTSTQFGVQRLRNGRPVGRHRGYDIAAPTGTPVYAPAAGRVVLSQNYKKYGNTIILDHGQGITSFYIHMSGRTVKKGQTVARGQQIGKIGATGVATGPHLHWSTYIFGTAVEPRTFLNITRKGGPGWLRASSAE